MEIIPVIDLLDNHVVHARQGERDRYRPISSSLCNSSELLHIMDALQGLYPFRQTYIADINAIQGRGNHHTAIKSLAAHYPNVDFWVDSGISRSKELDEWQSPGITCVIGSENLADKNDFLEIIEHGRSRVILSLDSKQSGYTGLAEIAEEAELWPDRVIAMTLNKVGSLQGPDFGHLKKLLDLGRKQSVNTRIYAAGGIRNTDDLQWLQDMGIAGVLIATSLHNGSITGEEIARLANAR